MSLIDKEVSKLYYQVFGDENFNQEKMLKLIVEYSDELKLKDKSMTETYEFIIEKLTQKKLAKEKIANSISYVDFVKKFDEKYGNEIDSQRLIRFVIDYLHNNGILYYFQVGKKQQLLKNLEEIFTIYKFNTEYLDITFKDFNKILDEMKTNRKTRNQYVIDIKHELEKNVPVMIYKYLFMKFIDKENDNQLNLNNI